MLRREIDRNPDDPGLYERLAIFLDQNRLGAEQEEIYKRAMAHFPDRSWYDKLARFYLRYKKNAEFESLTQEAVKTFSGTELERYFESAGYGGTPALYLRLNQYANHRFPHNPVFVRNLLSAYHDSHTYNDAAWQSLLRQHWFEEADLRNEFFEYLSSRGQLESEINGLRQNASSADKGGWDRFVGTNPAAGEFLAQADLWRSHFEDSAPVLQALAEQYPADFETGRTASAVYRSLAYFEPEDTNIAVKIEDNLLRADPGNTEIMARIGDIYADRELFANAAPYWDRIPQVAPGQSSGYLEAATIYWDYFDFDNALRLLNDGRKKLGDDNLYSYEAGAIYENQRDYPRAIDEYEKGAVAGGGRFSRRHKTARTGAPSETPRSRRSGNCQTCHLDQPSHARRISAGQGAGSAEPQAGDGALPGLGDQQHNFHRAGGRNRGLWQSRNRWKRFASMPSKNKLRLPLTR